MITGGMQTGEHMLVIPETLLLSPPRCRADPEIGHVFAENRDIFAGRTDYVRDAGPDGHCAAHPSSPACSSLPCT